MYINKSTGEVVTVIIENAWNYIPSDIQISLCGEAAFLEEYEPIE